MEVFACGSEVLLDDVLSARVTAIQIRGEQISYEVVWWHEGGRHVEWVEAWEIKADNESARRRRIDPVL